MGRRLSATEMMVAAYIGCARNVWALTHGSEPGHGIGFDNTWTANVEGAAGEMFVAKTLDIYWCPRVGADRYNGDVGPYEVRTNSSRRWDDTPLHPSDRDDRVFIGVLSFMPEFEIMGWIWGHEGKRQEWWRDGSPGRPAFWVPRSALHSMAELPSVEALAVAA